MSAELLREASAAIRDGWGAVGPLSTPGHRFHCAVADWLDAEADTGEQLRDVLREVEGRDDLNWEYGGLGKALAVARAYLGRDA